MLPWSDGWSWLPVDSEWQMVHPVTCKIFYICVPFSSVLWQRSRCFWHVGSESSSNHKGLLQQHDVILDVFTPKTRPSPAQVLCIMCFFFFFLGGTWPVHSGIRRHIKIKHHPQMPSVLPKHSLFTEAWQLRASAPLFRWVWQKKHCSLIFKMHVKFQQK